MFTRGREKTFTGLTSGDQQQQEQKSASLTNFERNRSGLSNLAAPGPAAPVMRAHTHEHTHIHTDTLTHTRTLAHTDYTVQCSHYCTLV